MMLSLHPPNIVVNPIYSIMTIDQAEFVMNTEYFPIIPSNYEKTY